MIVVKIGKWSSRRGFRFYYERIYIKGKWTPFCKKEERNYEKGGCIPWIGPISREGLKEIISKAIVDENEEEDYMNLKECPRCEGDAVLVVEIEKNLLGDNLIASHVTCESCGIRTRTYACRPGSAKSVEDAITDWNREEWMRDGCE